MHQRLKHRLQTFVVATSIPPLKNLYIGIYRLVIWLTTRRLARYPAVLAVYLKRGCARGEIVPGISDIDMIAIVDDLDDRLEKSHTSIGPAQKGKKTPKKTSLLDMGWYRSYLDRFPMLDDNLETKTWSKFKKSLMSSNFRRYRLAEAKTVWQLQYGKDLLGELPLPEQEEFNDGTYGEVQRWWTQFTDFLIGNPQTNQRPLTYNSICYRVCCETIKATKAMQGGPVIFHRKGVLKGLKPQLTNSQQSLIEKLENLQAKRFLPADATIVEESKQFLLTFMDRAFGDFNTYPSGQSLQACSQTVDFSLCEAFTNAASHHTEALTNHIAEQWGSSFCGAYLTPSILAELDEMLLLIQVDPQNLPSIGQLADLLQRCRTLKKKAQRTISPFILLDNAAYSLDAQNAKRDDKRWHSLLLKACNFDVFTLLNRPEMAIRDGGYRTAPTPQVPKLLTTFVRESKMRQYRKLSTGHLDEWDPLSFSRSLWKYLQMVVMAHGLAKGRLVYPLTLAAIERGLATAGHPRPKHLNSLAPAYRQALAGDSVDLAGDKVAALDWIASLDHGH